MSIRSATGDHRPQRRCADRRGRPAPKRTASTTTRRSAPTSRRAPSPRRTSCGGSWAPRTWQPLGTDDNAPYRVFHDVSDLPVGTPLEYRAVVKDAGGRVGGRLLPFVQVVSRPSLTVPRRPVIRRKRASGRRGHRRHPELGRWAARRTGSRGATPEPDRYPDAKTGPGRRQATLPAGPYAYKAALNRAWTENYGDGRRARRRRTSRSRPTAP